MLWTATNQSLISDCTLASFKPRSQHFDTNVGASHPRFNTYTICINASQAIDESTIYTLAMLLILRHTRNICQ
jgi:hypothetical protein